MNKLGDRAIRFPRPRAPARAIVRAVKAWPGVIDVVVAEHDVAAYFDREPHVDEERIRALEALRDEIGEARTIELRAIYDGPDLEVVAAHANLSTEEVATIHQDSIYVVETIGFAPGFAYMSGLDPRLCAPRRSTPRLRVPAGSIGIAGDRTGVYPFDSPGGWNLVGRVLDVKMFGPEGSLLHLGDRVRFVR
jgi:UPF0271 protein